MAINRVPEEAIASDAAAPPTPPEPVATRQPALFPGEPVKVRIARRHRQWRPQRVPVTDASAPQRSENEEGNQNVERKIESRRPAPAHGDARPDYAMAALLDVVADPESGIVRTHLAGAPPATIEWLETQATARGLHTRSACSPSLQRGWMVVERGGLDEGGESGNGRLDFRRTGGSVSRVDARLRRGLREALAWLHTWGNRVPQRESV